MIVVYFMLGCPLEAYKRAEGGKSFVMIVTIEIDSKWVKMIRSPIYVIVSSLTGVSISFAPLFLYWSGKGKFLPRYQWLAVPLCFAVIYLVPLFYFRLGNIVAKAVRGALM